MESCSFTLSENLDILALESNMERLLNPYRITQLFLIALTWLGLKLNGFDYDASMLYIFISLTANLALVLFNSGMISTKMILSFLIYSIALVPAIAYYLLGFKLYSYVNFDHQLTDSVTIEMLWLFYLSSNIYTFIVLARDTKYPDLTKNISYETRLPFSLICILVLFFAYLGNTGPTILTVSYEQIIDNRTSLATLAAIASTVFWVDAYAKMRVYVVEKNYFKVKVFWIVTIIMTTWLVLHARRTEAIGIISILLIHQKLLTGKTPYKHIVIALFFGFLLYLIGYLRVAALSEIDIAQTVDQSLALTFESGSTKTEFANMPSGLGNITATMQTSVYHFDYMSKPLLGGSTIFTYPIKMLPTMLVKGFGLADTDAYYYHNLVLEEYYYNGGCYLYAPAYGNFGTIGLVVASFLMGLMVNWTQRAMRSSNFIKIAIAATVIFSFIKICWYNFIPLPKAIVYNLIVLFYVAMIFRKKEVKAETSNIELGIA